MSDEVKVRTYQLKIEGVDSVEDLRKAIEELNERLKTLNETSKEYEKTLEELSKLQGKLAESINGTTASFKESSESVAGAKETLAEFGAAVNEVVGEQGLSGMKEKVDEVVQTNTELDDSLTKQAESMKELRNQIKLLKDRLVQLEEGTDAYTETVAVLVEKQRQLNSITSATKKDNTALEGSYDALAAKMSALRKEWKATTDEAKRAELGKQIADINTQLKAMDASIGNYQRNVGNYANAMREVFGNPRQQIRMLRQELANLEVGTERYNQVLMEMADLTQKQRHFQDQLRFSSSNLEDIFGNMAGVASSVVGGFSALNAAMGLFGEGNSDIQKAMLKTQQLMALVQGLNGLAGLKDKLVGLIDGMKGFASRFGAANKSTKDFADSARAAGGASQEATGAMDAQAGVGERLAAVMDALNEKERNTVQVTQDKIASLNSEIATLKEEVNAERERLQTLTQSDAYAEAEKEIIRGTIQNKREHIEVLKEEIATQEAALEKIIEEGRQRKLLRGELTQEMYDRMKSVDAKEKEVSRLEDEIMLNERILQSYEKRIAEIEKMAQANGELSESEKTAYSFAVKRSEQMKGGIANLKAEYDEKAKLLNQDRQELTVMQERANRMKQLDAERAKLRKGQVLAIAQNKLERAELKALMAAEKADAAQKKGLASAYMALATASRVASVAVKTVKTALISSGIGALLVIFGSAITKIISGIGEWISGEHKLNAELGVMEARTEELRDNLKELQQIANGFGFTQFKKASIEIKELGKIAQSTGEAFAYAVQEGKKETDELRDAWYEAQDALNDALLDGTIMINKLIADVDKADRQKGMTQLEKDLDDTNRKFEDAIALVRTFGEEGVWSAEMVEAKINSLNNALDKQKQMLTEAAQSATTSSTTHTGKSEWEKQKEEAEKLYKEMDEQSKTEQQKLREKYEKEKKLLEKFHLDTTKLTEKYYKDLEKIRIEANKASYDKWKAHLDAELRLMQSAFEDYEVELGSTTADGFAKMVEKGMQDDIPVMEKALKNLIDDFNYTFGASTETPMESLFGIQKLDEIGSKAISITDDIKESMQEMGLDPTNIEDIETMIDKWMLDKKAIDDANKELVKYKSNIKIAAAEATDERMQASLDKMVNGIDNEFAVMETESRRFLGLIDGWYDGLSPDQLQQQFDMRYSTLEAGLQQEYDLWKAMAEDETLTIEDRNKATMHLNEVMAQQDQLAVNKTVDRNNLLIKSFQNVTNSLSSMASNMASIFGTVGDIIMESANRQVEAGEISQEVYEQQFEKAKAFQIAQATIQTIAGAVGAFMGITRDTGGWGIAAAAIEAAAVLAAGFAQIQQIRNTKPETSSTGGGGGGGTTAFNLPNVLTPEPQRVENYTSQSDIDALANALGGRLNDQRVYVLDSDIQDANNRSNKRRAEVSF